MKLRSLAFLLTFSLFLVPLAWATSPLDGKTYKGEVKTEGEEKGDEDSFIFKDGTFRSSACDEYGFKEAPYTLINKDGYLHFTATTKNKEGGTITWSGSVTGANIEGTAHRKMASGKSATMTFTGVQQ